MSIWTVAPVSLCHTNKLHFSFDVEVCCLLRRGAEGGTLSLSLSPHSQIDIITVSGRSKVGYTHTHKGSSVYQIIHHQQQLVQRKLAVLTETKEEKPIINEMPSIKGSMRKWRHKSHCGKNASPIPSQYSSHLTFPSACQSVFPPLSPLAASLTHLSTSTYRHFYIND